MMIILKISILTSLLVLGVTISQSDPSMWLYPLAEKLDGKKWAKPFLTCEWCMPSVYTVFGYAGYWFLYGIDYSLLALYPFCVGCASFISGSAWKIIVLIQTQIDANIKASSTAGVRSDISEQ